MRRPTSLLLIAASLAAACVSFAAAGPSPPCKTHSETTASSCEDPLRAEQVAWAQAGAKDDDALRIDQQERLSRGEALHVEQPAPTTKDACDRRAKPRASTSSCSKVDAEELARGAGRHVSIYERIEIREDGVFLVIGPPWDKRIALALDATPRRFEIVIVPHRDLAPVNPGPPKETPALGLGSKTAAAPPNPGATAPEH